MQRCANRSVTGRGAADGFRDRQFGLISPVYREGTVYREPEIGVNPDFNPFRTDTVKEKVHKMPVGGGVSPRTAPLDGWQNLYEIDSRAGDAGLADRFDEMDSALQAFLEGEPEPVQQSLELGGTAGFCGQLKLSDRLYATTLGDALAVVDVGRARERVLFERYLRLLGNNATVSQQLLFPERIELSPADGRLMAEIREELSSLGFEFSANGPAGVTAENGPADNKGAGEGVTYEITASRPNCRQVWCRTLCMKRLPVCANWVVCRKVRRYAIWRPYWRGAALPARRKLTKRRWRRCSTNWLPAMNLLSRLRAGRY